MSQIAGPYGLRVVKLLGDLPFSGGSHTYPLTSSNTLGFYFGDPVGLQAGQPVPVTATPVAGAAVGPNNPIGVFMGCSYQDPRFGFVNAQYLPANAMGLGYTQIMLKIADYPRLVMQVQANGSVPINKIGMNAALIGFGAGNAAIGNSIVAVDATSVLPAAAAVRIYDYVYTPAPAPGMSSQPGDPFTDLLVTWCPGVHRFDLSAGL